MTFGKLNQTERENLFRRALANGDIKVHFQPVINSICQEVMALEALARWESDDYGKISPAEFIPLVDSCDLVDAFGAHILQSACYAASGWQRRFQNLRLSVNVSTSQFLSAGFVETVDRALARTKFPAGQLELELTEGTLTADSVVTEDRLAALSDLGVSIALENFGSHSSSLGALNVAAFDRVKIDRSFISGLGHDHASQAIVQAIVNLSVSMNLYVVAVGVETPVQEDIVNELGCYEVQGFLHAGPMPKDQIGEFLRMQNSTAAKRQRVA